MVSAIKFICLAFFVGFIAQSVGAQAEDQTVRTSNDQIQAYTAFEVHFTGANGGRRDLIVVVPAGAAEGPPYRRFSQLKGRESGTVELRGLPPGEYETRLLINSKEIAASHTFRIVDNDPDAQTVTSDRSDRERKVQSSREQAKRAQLEKQRQRQERSQQVDTFEDATHSLTTPPVIRVANPTSFIGDPIVFDVENLRGKTDEYINLVNMDAPDRVIGNIWTDSSIAGTWAFRPQAPGDYEIQVRYPDPIAKRVYLVVAKQPVQVVTRVTSAEPGSPPRVRDGATIPTDFDVPSTGDDEWAIEGARPGMSLAQATQALRNSGYRNKPSSFNGFYKPGSHDDIYVGTSGSFKGQQVVTTITLRRTSVGKNGVVQADIILADLISKHGTPSCVDKEHKRKPDRSVENGHCTWVELLADYERFISFERTWHGLWTLIVGGISPDVIEGPPDIVQAIASGAITAEDMYQRGLKLDKQDTYGEAAWWFRQSAIKGHMLAQYNLGHMYYEGQGVIQSFRSARHWFEEAAAQGHAASKYNLGIMSARGLGGAVNPQRARGYFAAAAGSEDTEVAASARNAMTQVDAAERDTQQAQQGQDCLGGWMGCNGSDVVVTGAQFGVW